MSKRNYSRTAVTEMVFALPTNQWQMRLVPDDDHSDLPVISPTYSTGQLINAVKFLRHENMNGYHIYGRPITCRHILVDDLGEDAMDQLRTDGLGPAFGVRTSKGNHQAWITLSKDEVEPDIAKAAAIIVGKRYGGDLGSTDAQHMGRLPGFTNRKDIYRSNELYPFTGLKGQVLRGVAPAAPQLLIEAETLAASFPTSPPCTLGACGPANTNLDIDPSRSIMTETEAIEIYDAELQYQAQRMNWDLPITKGMRSDADFYICRGLKQKSGFDPDDLAALLTLASDKAADNGIKYVIRTVNAACSK